MLLDGMFRLVVDQLLDQGLLRAFGRNKEVKRKELQDVLFRCLLHSVPIRMCLKQRTWPVARQKEPDSLFRWAIPPDLQPLRS